MFLKPQKTTPLNHLNILILNTNKFIKKLLKLHSIKRIMK